MTGIPPTEQLAWRGEEFVRSPWLKKASLAVRVRSLGGPDRLQQPLFGIGVGVVQRSWNDF
eukprot:10162307-Lingulodinium_polyedra.AAC.1